MSSEVSEIPDSEQDSHNGVSRHLHVEKFKNDHPDYPRRADDMTKEEYLESVKEYFKTKGKFHNMRETHAIRNSSSFSAAALAACSSRQYHLLLLLLVVELLSEFELFWFS